MLIIFDTETTGIYNFKLNPDTPSQPRICQLAMRVYTDNGKLMNEVSTLIKPSGDWKMSEGAQKVHGITRELCERYGTTLHLAINTLGNWCREADVIIGHNIKFDLHMLHREYCLLTPDRGKELLDFMHGLIAKKFCTMHENTDVLKLQGRFGNYKWPQLIETYRYYFGKDFDNAHDAMGDVIATADIYFEMQKRKQANG